MAKKAALGRGLSALLDSNETEVTTNIRNNPEVLGSIAELSIDSIEINPFQPRTHFDEDGLQELTDSIKVHGIIQPITVRKLGLNKYQLISGERRFRASQRAGLNMIPAYVRVANDQTMLEMALVENIQRRDLDAIEVAISYQRLIDECQITQEELGKKVSKNRSTVTNYLRLLKLPAIVQKGIREGDLSMGHARSIVSLDNERDQQRVFAETVRKNLSVRQVEELVRKIKNPSSQQKGATDKIDLSYEQQKHMSELESALRTKLSIKQSGNGKGNLSISFGSAAELDRILELLNP